MPDDQRTELFAKLRSDQGYDILALLRHRYERFFTFIGLGAPEQALNKELELILRSYQQLRQLLGERGEDVLPILKPKELKLMKEGLNRAIQDSVKSQGTI